MIIVAYYMVVWFGWYGLVLASFMWLGSLMWLDRALTKREMVRMDAGWVALGFAPRPADVDADVSQGVWRTLADIHPITRTDKEVYPNG